MEIKYNRQRKNTRKRTQTNRRKKTQTNRRKRTKTKRKKISQINRKSKRRTAMKLNMSENNYRKLLIRKRLSKNQKKNLDKALHIKYCKCVKDLKYSKKNPAAYGICANSVYKNRGYEMPPRAARNCEKYYK